MAVFNLFFVDCSVGGGERLGLRLLLWKNADSVGDKYKVKHNAAF